MLISGYLVKGECLLTMGHKNPAQKNVKIIKNLQGPVKTIYLLFIQVSKIQNHQLRQKCISEQRNQNIICTHCYPILIGSSNLELRRGIHMLRVKSEWAHPRNRYGSRRSPSQGRLCYLITSYLLGTGRTQTTHSTGRRTAD